MGKDFLEYVDQCITGNYMMGVLITSAAQGILESIGMDFGVGKSTLGGQIVYGNIIKYGKDENGNKLGRQNQDGVWVPVSQQAEELAWSIVKQTFHRFPWELEDFIANRPRRYPGEPIFYIYDDIQETLGKDKSRDAYVRNLYNRTTTRRRKFAVFVATAPDIGEIAKCWRQFFRWEIKVPSRGRYEVQHLAKKTEFDDPYEVKAWMPKDDCAISVDFSFPKFPPEIDRWYDDWKEEMNKRSDEGEGGWNLKGVKNVMTDSAKTLLQKIVAKGSYTRQTIVADMDQAVDLKLLKSTGMVEQFEDSVVPTKQARLMIKML